MANFEKLTIKSAEALQAARALAVQRENPVVNDAHKSTPTSRGPSAGSPRLITPTTHWRHWTV